MGTTFFLTEAPMDYVVNCSLKYCQANQIYKDLDPFVDDVKYLLDMANHNCISLRFLLILKMERF